MKIVCELHHICPHFSTEIRAVSACLIDSPNMTVFGETTAECKRIMKVNNYKEYTFKEQMKRALYESRKSKNTKSS